MTSTTDLIQLFEVVIPNYIESFLEYDQYWNLFIRLKKDYKKLAGTGNRDPLLKASLGMAGAASSGLMVKCQANQEILSSKTTPFLNDGGFDYYSMRNTYNKLIKLIKYEVYSSKVYNSLDTSIYKMYLEYQKIKPDNNYYESLKLIG